MILGTTIFTMTTTNFTPRKGTAAMADPEELPQLVKLAHRSFPTGVTVVTASVNGQPVGLAVNAFSSVSMDPPIVLACVNSGSRSHAALCDADVLGIKHPEFRAGSDRHDLRDIGRRQVRRHLLAPGVHGAPLLDSVSAAFEVEVTERIGAGTHTVFFGCVRDVEVGTRPPLLYSAGEFFDGGRLRAV